jgi:hypothetical protein
VHNDVGADWGGVESRVVVPIWAKMTRNGISNLEIDFELFGGHWELNLNSFGLGEFS